jgi:hypothetical protein
MPVYLGIHCRHILCVMVKLEMEIPWQSANSRWWRECLQPTIHLKNKSPFQSKQELVSGVDDGPGEEVAPEVVLEAEAVDFEQYVADNGGGFGEDSILDSADVVILEGSGKPLEKITPKERRNELTNYFYQLVQRVGFGKGSLEAMDDLYLKYWRRSI